VVKKIVTAEQADAFKSVVNQIAGAPHAAEEEAPTEKRSRKVRPKILNAVLDSLPEAENTPKPKRRRATSAGKAAKTVD